MDHVPDSVKASILIIDDTPENLTLLSTMLCEQGYKVRSVTKGSSGLRGAQAVPPDLILLDINMPQMNGYEVCQRLKADPRTCEIPVIFISALEDVLDKVKAFMVGGIDYITKPFQVAEVLARIETHLTLRRLQRQLQHQNAQLQQEIQERQQAEEKFAKAFRSSPTPIAIATLADGRFIDVNPSFLQMSGYSRAAVIGHTVTELHLGITANTYQHLIQQLSETQVIQNQEAEFRTQSGLLKNVLLSIEQIDLAGEACILCLINDITERKRLENEFISLVSHELRTPMTSLTGALDILGSGQLGPLTEQGQKVLSIAMTNTERLIRLVNDILDLERMKSGHLVMHKSECPIADLMIQATETMQALADRAQVTLITEPIEATLWADRDRILQTLTNLLSNAIKFSEPSSAVTMSATLSGAASISTPGPIAHPYPSTPSSLLITVQDHGRGIPTDKQHLIFERFQQVDASDSRQKGGTGLGLAICRNIVEQHDGQIWVESDLGKGSTFSILLPLHEFFPIHG